MGSSESVVIPTNIVFYIFLVIKPYFAIIKNLTIEKIK